MKIMVTGASGQLGRAVMRAVRARGMEVWGVSTADFDLTDAAAVNAAVLAERPDAVIHCAAYTAVDLAESEPARCMAVNAAGTMNLARAAAQVKAKLLYVSTDYVFSGEGDQPHETEERPGPLNVYGLSKWQGEEAVRALCTRFFIVRTSWVFGLEGRNFVRTMLRLGRSQQTVRVVDDQIGAPTYAEDLAVLLAEMIRTERYGMYHAANEGCCSFADFAAAIMRASGSSCRVEPIRSEEYPSAARRPLNSRLSMRSLDENGFRRLPMWEDALTRFLRAAGEAEG